MKRAGKRAQKKKNGGAWGSLTVCSALRQKWPTAIWGGCWLPGTDSRKLSPPREADKRHSAALWVCLGEKGRRDGDLDRSTVQLLTGKWEGATRSSQLDNSWDSSIYHFTGGTDASPNIIRLDMLGQKTHLLLNINFFFVKWGYRVMFRCVFHPNSRPNTMASRPWRSRDSKVGRMQTWPQCAAVYFVHLEARVFSDVRKQDLVEGGR